MNLPAKNMTITYKLITHRGENRILLLFDYDVKKTARLKENTDARWSKTHKGWHIADTAANRIACKLALNDTVVNDLNSNINILQQKQVALPELNAILPIIKPAVFTDSNNELRIELLFDKNQLLQHAVKKIKGVRWNSVKVCWHIACTKKCFDELCSLTAGIAMVDKKMLSKQLHKIKALQQTAALVKNTSIPKSSVLLHNISHYNLQLLQTTMEHLQLKGYSPSTQKTYRNEVAVFLQTLKNTKADSLVTEDIRKYIHE